MQVVTSDTKHPQLNKKCIQRVITMRYELFQKVRRRQKEALFIKAAAEVTKSQEPDDKENDSDTTTEMRNPVARHGQTTTSTQSKPYSREITRKKVSNIKDQRKRGDGDPTDLADAIRTTSRPQRKGFLPIAMPSSRPLPAVQHDSEYDYRSEFDAPEHIDVVQIGSQEDARTDVSEITGLTFGPTHRVLPGHIGFSRQPKLQERFVPHIEHLEDVVEVLEDRKSRSSSDSRRLNVDVTDLDNIHEAARRVRRELRHPTPKVETRYGLPYESTDFKADDDDGSEDSWGVAIVGGHNRLHGLPSTPDSPIDAEVFFSESATTPRSNKNDVEIIREGIWKAEMGPKSPASLIKETMSAEGEVIIDLSDLVDEGDFGAVEVSRKSPKRSLPVQVIPASHPVEREYAPKTIQVPVSPVAVALPRSPKQEVSKPESNDRNILSSPQEEVPFQEIKAIAVQEPAAAAPAAPAAQVSNETRQDTPTTPDLIEASMNYIKTVAGNITSQLQKIDLLPDRDMSSMLGVLDKDLQATSRNVPETQVVVEFFGEQLRRGACTSGGGALGAVVVEDDTGISVPPKTMNRNFQSPSVDEMVGVVRRTYQTNLGNCGGIGLDYQLEKQTPAPQTFIVPISLRGFDYESEYYSSPEPTVQHSISARQRRN